MAERRDYLDEVLPLFPGETEAVVRARYNAWANEGRDPADGDSDWTDTRDGSLFQILTESAVRNDALTTDRFTELYAQLSPLFSWAPYLDDLAEAADIERLSSTAATGTVRFTAPAGTVIPSGTVVSVEEVPDEEDVPEYETTAAATVAVAETFVDVPVVARRTGSFANAAPGAVSVLETAVSGVTAVTNVDAISGGTDVQGDEALSTRLTDRFRDTGGFTAARYRTLALSEDGVGQVTVLPLLLGPGSVVVVVSTAEGGPVSETVRASLQDRLDPPSFRTTLTAGVDLPQAIIPVVTTVGSRAASSSEPGFLRIGTELVRYTGRTATTFTGCTGGDGVYASGTAVEQSGEGGGLAPAGHHVIVRTVQTLAITVAAQVDPETGFTVAGSGGLQEIITESVRSYIDSVEPGGEVVLAQVLARIARTPGVHDVGTVTLNGSAANVAVAATPNAQKPTLVTPLTLTEIT